MVSRTACIALCALFVLAPGCRSTPVKPIPYACPTPPVIARPALPYASIPTDAPDHDVMRAWAATIEALRGYAEQLEVGLRGL